MIFADASALVAILAAEPDAAALTDALEREAVGLCSAVSIWETVAALCHSYGLAAPLARSHVDGFIKAAGLQFVSVGQMEYELATKAFATYGKGRHPARLNMGDCFAYACAKSHGVRLLYKGDDFSLTDMA